MKKTLGISIILAASFTFAANAQNGVTFEEAADPLALTAEQKAQWDEVGDNLNAAWGDSDFAYQRSVVPAEVSSEPLHLTVWKGERASALAMMWSSEAEAGVECKVGDFKTKGARLPSSIATAHFVRYTIADQQTPAFMKTHRYKPGKTPAMLAPDMLDSLSRFDMAARTARPVWVSINVPHDAKPGIYKSKVEFSSGRDKVVLPLELEVVNHTLQTPDKWSYHLDLWQHPSAVARMLDLDMWSDEPVSYTHLRPTRPY